MTFSSALSAAVGRLVRWSASRSRFVFLGVSLLTVLCLTFSINAIDIRTDLDALLPSTLPWRAEAARVETAFPDQGDDITLVIDAATPEHSDAAAAAMANALVKRTDLFHGISRLNGGAFIERQLLLFLPLSDVRQITDEMIAAQPFIGPLAADPTLRGLMTSTKTILDAAAQDPAQLNKLERPLEAVNRVASSALDGQPSALSWQTLLAGEGHSVGASQFIEVMPNLNYSNTAPAAESIAAIRETAKTLGLDSAHGVRLRITGSVPIAEEELATLGESVGFVALIACLTMLAILLFAVRDTRIVLCIVMAVSAGAIITCALGLLLFNRFNLISIAFLPLFFGLAIDFAIQLCVRAQAERRQAPSLPDALTQAGKAMGPGLVLATLSTAAGFFAFLPTEYRGVRELGAIAGIGMLVALVLTLTFLPAVLVLLRPGDLHTEKPLAVLGRLDRFIQRRAMPVTLAALIAGFVCAGLAPSIAINYDPMALRSDKGEAVATYRQLAKSVEYSPDTINVLAPSLAAADALAAHLRQSPYVGDALTLTSLAPRGDQTEKLAVIANARAILEFSLNPWAAAPPGSDAENIVALKQIAAKLNELDKDPQAPNWTGSLAKTLLRLSDASLATRKRVEVALTSSLPTTLRQLNAALQTEAMTPTAVPEPYRSSWVSPAGLARIEVIPAKPLQSVTDIKAFVSAVRDIAPNAAGDAVTIVESGRTISRAFVIAGTLSLAMIAGLLWVALGSARWAAIALAPVLLAGALTLATCAALDQEINLENMIAAPLILGIGVAFNIYYVAAWKAGDRDILQSSLSRAIMFSALTTGTSFAALAASAHPGTASMGLVLLISLGWIVAATFLVSPALLKLFAAGDRLPSAQIPG